MFVRDQNEGDYRENPFSLGKGSDFDQPTIISDPDGEDHFLLETYVAFTCIGSPTKNSDQCQ